MALKQNIIYIYFKGKHQVTSKSQYQYNRRQYLYFADLNLPQAFEVHFSNKDKGESKTQIGSDNLVEIPDEYFWNGALQIYAWIYLHSKTTDGETIYEVRIPLTKRAKPTDEEPLPVQQSTIDRAIAELNNAVDITTENANKTDSDKIIVSNIKEDVITLKENIDSTATIINQKAQETIDASERAEISAQNAATSENKALNYSQQAEQSAQSALESKNIAQQKSEVATNASNEALGYRDEALEAKNQAVQAKQNIVDYRDETKGYRDETLNFKNDVQTLKNQIDETSEEIEGISSTVNENAQSASQSASSASQSANSASQSANSASQSANQAEEFKNQSATNVTHYPKVVDGYWYVWDASKNEYVNTNVDARGVKGDKGDVGNGIENTVLNSDYTLTITFTDGTSYTTPSIRGEKGIKGDVGNGIASTVLNDDYTLTITFTDGTTYKTPSIRGEKGEKGEPGTNMEIHICSITEYDAETRMPTIANPDSSTFYLVPTEDGTSPDLFTEWVYVNGAWEMFGSASVDLTDYVKNTDIATTDDFGIIKIGMGLKKSSDNKLYTDYADGLAIKTGTNNYRPITPYHNKESTFYGLAKASGDTTQSQSDNPVGTYTDKAKASIQSMLGTEPKLEKIYTTILDTTITTVIDEEHNYPYTSYSNVTINEQYKYRITLNDIVVESSVGIWYENRNNGVKGISFIGNPNLYNDKIPKVINSLPNQTFCLVYIGDLTDNYFQVYTSEAGKYNLKIERITYNKSQLPYSLIYGNDEAPIKRIYNNSSYQSIDIGHNALISRGSVAIGSFNTVSKEFGVAIGMLNNVSSENAIAVGLNTTASGNSSYAEGKTTTASGDNSHAEGVNSIASGYGSHAEGDATQATGINAHSEGFKSVASSNYSHSEGYETKASKPYSHSEGANTLAGGNVSHAEGYGTQATGMCSHAEGNSTIASNANQHVQGIFNIKDLNNTYADIVGNGDSDNNRSNAYALDWSGNGHYMGDVYVGANTDSTGGTKVATVNDIPEVPVDDVQINGTSIVENGVANVPIAGGNNFGVVKINTGKGIQLYDGVLNTVMAGDTVIKSGSHRFYVITPNNQHSATFYGLAKSAGDTTQSQSSNAVGNYTDNAKDKIQTMLGVSPLIALHESDPFESAHVIGELFIINGKLYRAKTALTVGEYINEGTNVEVVNTSDVYVKNTDIASLQKAGIVKVASTYGIQLYNGEYLRIDRATLPLIKQGTDNDHPIVTQHQHESTFYGLAKASGDTTQSQSSNAVGTYTDEAKTAIKTMLGVHDTYDSFIEEITGTDVTITGQPSYRYNCGEVLSLSITPPSSGTIDIRFTSGSTPTVLTFPSTIKMPEWWVEVEANTIYEMCITDGIYCGVMSWAM